ncbi:TrbC/VirB2 family protein [Candidatus Anaplasma sp. TIGMIC]|uniref:TrbC/VirB2 family protein n=1 Tax=Candidatus Anaplasma sp. TIGMIC TaxID=3020713 RepID=UPI00232E6944|nr:TrbC/VirB2 family protein [Candidatus Anaplasma sp. TIGMIC]MDB1135672.1 TrbC/VirB2 family protein [Candidatus Anaplasma sp. TIGMIC]
MVNSETTLGSNLKTRALFIISRMFMCLVLLLVLDEAHAQSRGAGTGTGNPLAGQNTPPLAADSEEITSKVICNVVRFVRGIGLPIMTGVIVGSSIMAIFGRMAWPAIAALIVFTAIFFGAEKMITKFAAGVSNAQSHNCDTV